MVGEKFEIYTSQRARTAFKLSTMVGENFEIYPSQIAEIAIMFPPWMEKILKFIPLKCVELP